MRNLYLSRDKAALLNPLIDGLPRGTLENIRDVLSFIRVADIGDCAESVHAGKERVLSMVDHALWYEIEAEKPDRQPLHPLNHIDP